MKTYEGVEFIPQPFLTSVLYGGERSASHPGCFFFPPYGATAPKGALVYLHETLRFTSFFLILDRR
jgi:hypothetical protein